LYPLGKCFGIELLDEAGMRLRYGERRGGLEPLLHEAARRFRAGGPTRASPPTRGRSPGRSAGSRGIRRWRRPSGTPAARPSTGPRQNGGIVAPRGQSLPSARTPATARPGVACEGEAVSEAGPFVDPDLVADHPDCEQPAVRAEREGAGQCRPTRSGGNFGLRPRPSNSGKKVLAAWAAGQGNPARA